MKKRLSLLTTTTLVTTIMLTAGCQSLNPAKLPANQLVGQALNDSFYQSYQFSGQQTFKVSKLTKPAPQQAPQQASLESTSTYQARIARCQAEQSDTNAYYNCLLNIADDVDAVIQQNNEAKADATEMAELFNQQLFDLSDERISAIQAYLAKPAKISFNGTYLPKQGKLAFNSQFSYRPKNLTVEYQVPMLLDFNELSVTLDPAAALPILSIIFDKGIGTDWEDKSVKFYVPAEIKQQIPTDMLLGNLPKAMQVAFNQIDAKQFSYQPVDSYGNALNARYAVKATLSKEDNLNFLFTLFDEWHSLVEADAKAHPEKITNADNFYTAMTLFEGLLDEAKDSLTEVSDEDLAVIANLVPFLNGSTTDYYFDGQGRLIGYHKQQAQHANFLGIDIEADTQIQLTNFGTTTLNYNPAAATIVDGNHFVAEQIEAYKEGKGLFTDDLLAEASSDDDSDLLAETGNEDYEYDTAAAAEVDAAAAVKEAAATTVRDDVAVAVGTIANKVPQESQADTIQAFCEFNPNQCKNDF